MVAKFVIWHREYDSCKERSFMRGRYDPYASAKHVPLDTVNRTHTWSSLGQRDSGRHIAAVGPAVVLLGRHCVSCLRRKTNGVKRKGAGSVLAIREREIRTKTRSLQPTLGIIITQLYYTTPNTLMLAHVWRTNTHTVHGRRMIFVGGPARQTRTTVAATAARRRIPRCSNPSHLPYQKHVRDGGAHCTAVAAPSSHLHRRMYNNNRRRRWQVPHVHIEYAAAATNISTCYTRPSTINTRRRRHLDNKI